MINRHVDSHGNHPRVDAEREEAGPRKRVKPTPAKRRKMIAHKGIFLCYQKGGLCLVQWPISCANVLIHISNL